MPDSDPPKQSDPPRASDPGWWAIALIILFAGGILIAIASDARALTRLSDPAYARGLITWLIILTTIGIAFILIYQAFNNTGQSEEGFRRGREVFAGLMGIVGTIVGFYFGSTEKGQKTLEVAEFVREGQSVTTYVSGGTMPYRYSLKASDDALLKATDKVNISDTGWIRENLLAVPATGASISIEVIDAKDVKGSRKTEFKSLGTPLAAADRPAVDDPAKSSKPAIPASPPVSTGTRINK